jgi:hypothetical protein
MARERRLADPGECGGFVAGGATNGVGSAAGKLGKPLYGGGYIIMGL